jgi:serine/threonine protein kinase
LSELFPGFRIIRLIACGGMGAVYEAEQISLDRPVAIKILPREFTADASFRDAFESEAKTMARLNHPNLIGVYDFGEVEGMLYIIMEYVSGLSLFEASHGQPILQSEVVPLVAAIARGLAHAHENGIIHRDIKPSNILLNQNNEPKIGDFGLARPRERKIQEGETIFGTPGYTAPEVIQHPQTIDHHADIFSLGVLLHELLTGTLPEADPRNASSICRCDFRFDTIIRKATNPNPAQRYHNAAEIATELEKIHVTAGPRTLRTAAPAVKRKAPPKITAAQPNRPQSHRPQTHFVAKPSSSNVPLVALIAVPVAILIIIVFVIANRKPEPRSTPDPQTPTLPNPVPSEIPPPKRPGNVTPTPPPPPTPTPEPPPAIIHNDVNDWNGAYSFWDDSGDSVQFSVRSGRIGGTTDGGVFKHQRWNGDGVFTLHIQTLIGGVPLATGGLMIREELDPGARNLFLGCDRSGHTFLQSRQQRDGETTEAHRSDISLRHLRIHRQGDQLTASASANGTDWTDIGTVTLAGLPADIHVGFAAASATDNGDPLLTGSYDLLELSPPGAPPSDDAPIE